jgi:hypothetical protein
MVGVMVFAGTNPQQPVYVLVPAGDTPAAAAQPQAVLILAGEPAAAPRTEAKNPAKKSCPKLH